MTEKNCRIIDHPILTFDRKRKLSFLFNGRSVIAYEGETIAAALYSAGIRIFSRSFKYHRPRGLFCCAGHCSHCLMRVNGMPNVRTCREPVHDGMKVESQNAWPSLQFDLMAFAGKLDFLIRPGFYYRRFIRPRWLYHIWEKFLRNMAGIGKLADPSNMQPACTIKADPALVVVGGGIAGMSAALHAAKSGTETWIIEKEETLGGAIALYTNYYKLPYTDNIKRGFSIAAEIAKEVKSLDNCRVITGATAFAWYSEGILGVARPGEFWEIKPKHVIIAMGSYEDPMLFENNDLPGIFPVRGLLRLMHKNGIRPGRKAVVATCNDEGYYVAMALKEAGVSLAGIADSRHKKQALSNREAKELQAAGIHIYPEHSIKKAIGRRHVKGVMLYKKETSPDNHRDRKIKIGCDVLCIAGTRSPANDLVFQHTCRGDYILKSPEHIIRCPKTSDRMEVKTGLYVAGETSGSQGFAKAYLEGKIAGLSTAIILGHDNDRLEKVKLF